MNKALENLAILRLRISAKLEKEGHYRAGTATMEILVAQYVMAAATLMLMEATDRVADATTGMT